MKTLILAALLALPLMSSAQTNTSELVDTDGSIKMMDKRCRTSMDCPGASLCNYQSICVYPNGTGATKCRSSIDCPGTTMCNSSGVCK